MASKSIGKKAEAQLLSMGCVYKKDQKSRDHQKSGSAIRTSLLVRINPKNQQRTVYHLSLMVFRVD